MITSERFDHRRFRRVVLRLVVAGMLPLVACFAVEAHAEVNGKKPNILLLLGDDMGFSDIGPFGSEVDTPTLNDLARRGISFSNFHATPVCSVTRAELMTGNNNSEVGLAAFDYAVYPPAAGKPGYEGYLTRNTVAISELLRDAGYNTYISGKWHLGGAYKGGEGPSKWGFDRSYGIYVGGSNHWNQHAMLPDAKDPKTAHQLAQGQIPTVQPEKFFDNGRIVERPKGVYSDDLYTSKMIDYLEEGRASGKPFFAYMAFTTAHFPIQAPSELIEKYYSYYLEKGYEKVKRSRFEALKRKGVIPKSVQLPDTSTNPLVRPWDSLSEREKRFQARVMATYSAMIDSQDRHIARLFDYLRETDQFDNTLIIYLTDNGPEGTDLRGQLSNPLLKKWVDANFSGKLEDVGSGNANWQIGTSWANAATGALQWWKGFVSEGGIRVPLIISPPQNSNFARTGELTDVFVSVKDLPMTILDYAGVSHPQTRYQNRTLTPPSGVTARPFLEAKADRVRTESDWVAFELFGNAYVMAGDFKAKKVRKGMWGDGAWHLYNVRRDPGETHPLEAQQPARLQKLVSIYEAYAKKRGVVPVAEDWNPWTVVGQ